MSDWNGTVVVSNAPGAITTTIVTSNPTPTTPGVVAPRLVPEVSSSFLRSTGIQEYLPLAITSGKTTEGTYWRPKESQGEVGLLQAFSLRATVAHTSSLLLSSRPVEELRQNFSTSYGAMDVVDLTQTMFHYSRTARAMMQLDHVDDHSTVDGRTLKTGMRQQLPRLHEDDYFLFVYRDYSQYAIDTFSRAVKNRVSALRSMILGGARAEEKQFVEVYCAVCVGQSAGSLMLITASQFAYAQELLAHQRMTASLHSPNNNYQSLDSTITDFGSAAAGNATLTSLNREAFQSLGTLPSTISDAVYGMESGQPASPSSPPHLTRQASAYVAPSPWDWSPSAIERRLNHWLDSQYRSLGRMMFKGVAASLCIAWVYAVAKRRFQGDNNYGGNSSRGRSRSGNNNSSRYRNGGSSRGRGGDYHDEGIIEGMMRGVFVTAPQQLLDLAFGER